MQLGRRCSRIVVKYLTLSGIFVFIFGLLYTQSRQHPENWSVWSFWSVAQCRQGSEVAVTIKPFAVLHNEDQVKIEWETACLVDKNENYLLFSGSNVKLMAETKSIDSGHVLNFAVVPYSVEQASYHISYLPDHLVTVRRDLKNVNMIIVSDNQYASKKFALLLDKAKSLVKGSVDVIVHAGDVVHDKYDLEQWHQDFFAVIAKYLTDSVLVYAPGNHDYSGIYLDTGYKSLSMLSNHDVRLVTLNAFVGDSTQMTSQLEWFKQEMLKPARLRIVVIHVAPFAEYWDPARWPEAKQWIEPVKEMFVSLFEQYKVDLVISGHQHNYQRGMKNGVMYTIVGGGGGSLDTERVEDYGFYSVTRKAHHIVTVEISHGIGLNWKAYDEAGKLFDTFTRPFIK